ncbi:hypothetical protein K461DRAFT_303046 [Myriangium duriaei CBS 260.36]|uniref:Glutathione S-transferase n=1 Tax=Myriangium duriaei CBS 260.36 TaxID=1168546 RepID=A0A9P4MH87_9PEZI|nr:hypothetical protein K461DRAFT_303046 [Myriangium duriaei CBS 260.36]
MLEVYLDPCTVNCRKVLAGLDLIGTKYNVNFVSYFKGEQKSPEFRKINPMATLPAAIDGDLKIIESNAILQYAADLADSPAYPKDVAKRSSVNCWLLWEASAWFPSNYVYLVENVVKPLLKSEPDKSVTDAQEPKWKHLASVVEEQLSKSKWLAGDEVTIADIAVAAPMHLHAAQRLPLDEYPNLRRWLTERVEQLPAWQNTQKAVNEALLPNAMVNGDDATTKKVRSLFNYTKDLEPKLTELYFYETEASKGIHEPGDDPHEMEVFDGWDRRDSFSVDKEGFSLHDFKTPFNQWEDEDSVRSTFYPEVVSFLKKTVGAKRVLVFDHTIRSKQNEAKKLTQETNTSQRAPVMLVHCDYTSESGPKRVQQLLPDEAEELLAKRVAFLNVWKPIHRTVDERPLAMCDVTSSPTKDFFKLHLRYRDRDGENYVMKHSPSHKWWYFPQMTPEQVILLKTYESDTDGKARFVGHTAFEDPTSPKDAPLRESVEIRTIAFF